MRVEDNLISQALARPGKTNAANAMAKEELLRNYVPVVMEHISKHGCSGLKCKRCPLNNVCDRNAAKSKELANQMITYANAQRLK